ncbi:hypothetical protein AYP76_07515 [Ligilactobacillus agilis]|uniref:Uncharacterized protein n=1 Tax=Ligilactobacillus agilis TaxID=1601 RepID=A0A231QPB8_9LACO|nr:hypothetical protein [Ligilactobacillus agilis]OXC07228.1 hypothetical protein AYP74_08515 [Ligilactobacillus agilis]OXC07584.1 hypothetical protein AYP76_07515 [Ligilactobacillus agilis]OXC11029.1 hypothetical protein AYP75_05020 [Ligilactobacillus agilis]OXS40497.1 hypothetical protein AYP70_04285 [Ligilactobacillus agilis]OXS41062.1 hypothetical protein AYP69_03585 [Ligilactobacillus agilis]
MNILKEFIAKMPGSVDAIYNPNINKLVTFFSEYLSVIYNLFRKIEYYRNIDNASGKLLDEIGQKIGEVRGQADDEFYRIMLKSKVASRKGDATVNGILTIIRNSLGVDVRNIKVIPLENEPQAVIIKDIPLEFASDSWKQQYLLKRIEGTVAAGIRVQEIRFIDNTNTTVKVVLGTQSAIIVNEG